MAAVQVEFTKPVPGTPYAPGKNAPGKGFAAFSVARAAQLVSAGFARYPSADNPPINVAALDVEANLDSLNEQQPVVAVSSPEIEDDEPEPEPESEDDEWKPKRGPGRPRKNP